MVGSLYEHVRRVDEVLLGAVVARVLRALVQLELAAGNVAADGDLGAVGLHLDLGKVANRLDLARGDVRHLEPRHGLEAEVTLASALEVVEGGH